MRKQLDRLHDQYVLVPADKASNNIFFVCKAHYINSIFKELGFDSTHGNPTYTRSSISKQEILQNNKSVMDIFIFNNKQNKFDFPYLYWFPKLNKSPYKQRYIAGSSKFSTNLYLYSLLKFLQ